MIENEEKIFNYVLFLSKKWFVVCINNILNMNPLERQTGELQYSHNQEQIITTNHIVNAINKGQYQQAFKHFQQYHQRFDSINKRQSEFQQLSDREKFEIWEMYYHEALTYFNSGKHKRAQTILKKLLKLVSTKQINESNRSSRASSTVTMHLCQHQQQPMEYDLIAKYQPQLYLRILTSLICFKLKLHVQQNKQSTAKDVYNSSMKYLQMIKQNFIQRLQAADTYAQRQQILSFRKQIVGRLTGCYSVQQMKNIKEQDIEGTHPMKKSAIGAGQKKQQQMIPEMFRIAADWKYIVGQNEEAIQFKQKAYKCNQALKNLKDNKEIAEQVLAMKKEDHKSNYLQRLAIIKKIIDSLYELQGTQINYNSSAIIAKIGYLSILKELQKQQQKVDLSSSKRSSLSKSQLKLKQTKQQQINEAINNTITFYNTQFTQSKNSTNFYQIICPILYRSKFIKNKQIFVRGYLGVFHRIISQRKRYVVDKFKLKAEAVKNNSLSKSRFK